jgi:hypothetical protein
VTLGESALHRLGRWPACALGEGWDMTPEPRRRYERPPWGVYVFLVVLVALGVGLFLLTQGRCVEICNGQCHETCTSLLDDILR